MSIEEVTAKKDLRYVNNETANLNYSYNVFGEYFSDRALFDAFYNKINAIDEKNKFLKISTFYKFLIVDGELRNTKDESYNEYIDYFDLTYKYIDIFSFIEALYTKDEYKEFYDWLIKEAHYPIDNKKALDDLHTRYKQIYGSIKKAIRFFESLDDETKKLIQEKFEVYEGGQRQSYTDAYLAKLFYKIRNNFIHNADLVVQFKNAPKEEKPGGNGVEYKVLSLSSLIHFTIGNKEILSSLSFDDIKLIFERGFL